MTHDTVGVPDKYFLQSVFSRQENGLGRRGLTPPQWRIGVQYSIMIFCIEAEEKAACLPSTPVWRRGGGRVGMFWQRKRLPACPLPLSGGGVLAAEKAACSLPLFRMGGGGGGVVAGEKAACLKAGGGCTDKAGREDMFIAVHMYQVRFIIM